MKRIGTLLSRNVYSGRGIVVGLMPNGMQAAFAYFIMGRSENSRNRVFRVCGDEVRVEPFDPAKVTDPSLIIYSAVKRAGGEIVVTNGDQTDSIVRAVSEGHCFRHALMRRAFEPDAPIFTPRISAILHCGENFGYELSVLKCSDGKGLRCDRNFFTVEPLAGVGSFVHTYMKDGNPPPVFNGEPERVRIGNNFGAFAEEIWNNLNPENKISLYCRLVDTRTGDTAEELCYNQRYEEAT